MGWKSSKQETRQKAGGAGVAIPAEFLLWLIAVGLPTAFNFTEFMGKFF